MFDLRKYSKNILAVDDGKEFTYAEIADFADELSSQIKNRCLIFNLCSNKIGALSGYISFLNSKNVQLMLDKDIDRELLANFLDEYKPDYLWLPEDLAKNFEGKVIFSGLGYALLKRKDELVFPLYEELALLLTTSGSTGSPKFVRQSFKNILANTKSIVEYLKLDANERPITTLPMNYTYGLSIINTHLWVGAKIILTDATIMQRDFWDLFSEEKATSFGGVPYTYEMLDKLMFFRRKLPYLKTMTQAGGKILPSLHKKFAEYARAEGKNFVVMYGQAEATARMGYLPPSLACEKCGAMGKVIPNGKFRLLDTEGQEITQPETVGELAYQGDNVTLGYAICGQNLAKGDERNGFLVTGDMAKFDADGIFYIVGRKKRFLKIFGNRVGLDETERMIKMHYPNFECACCGKDDLMQVFITNSEKCMEIKKFLAEKTKLNPTAFSVKYINEIPKNAVGKTQYKQLELLCA